MFGAPPDDDPPASHRPPAVGEKREREEGLWQRVREHWWLSMSVDSAGAAWTGKHDQHSMVFPASVDGYYARRIACGVSEEVFQAVDVPPGFLAAVLEAGCWSGLGQQVERGVSDDGHVFWGVCAA
jgi:hypothetical protein